METIYYVVIGFYLLGVVYILLEIVFRPDNETSEDEDEGE